VTRRATVKRPYRLEIPELPFSTTTYATEELAREGVAGCARRLWVKPGFTWRITLRADKGRKTTPIAEGVFS
jgi:hypothetical protein